MQPDLLPGGRAERVWLIPDRAGHAGPPDVVQQPGGLHLADGPGGEPGQFGATGGDGRDVVGVAEQAPNPASCRDSMASSPKSSSFSQAWKAMSSSKSSAFSDACEVHPIARTSAAWNTTMRSSGGRPSSRPNAVATAQVRSPFSNATPEARSVVSDTAASTSATLIPATLASISTSGRPAG
jgi:hypothetical protein